MALYQRGGRWCFRYRLDGVQHRGSTGLEATERNRTAATDAEAEHRRDRRAGRSGQLKRVVFREAAERFLEWCDQEHKAHPNTAARIRTSFVTIRKMFDQRIVSDLEAIDFEQFKTWRRDVHKVKEVTIRHDLHAASKFFGYAIKARWARTNPIREIDLPSDRDAIRMHILTEAEEAAYFSVAAKVSKALHDVAKLILLTGARPDELMTARKEHFDPKAKTLLIPGGKTAASRRLLPLVKEAHQIVLWRSKASPLSPWPFPSSRLQGGHLTKLNAQHDESCRLAEVSFCLYDLRHTFATRMLVDARVDIATVAALLGHSGLRVVQRYIHPQAKHKADAMSAYEDFIRARAQKRAQKGKKAG